MSGEALENLSHEDRVFFPSEKFAANANAKAELYEAAKADRETFWNEQAKSLQWDQPWSQVLDWTGAPVSKWFVGGKLNVSVNCLDRHVAAGNGARVAIHFEGERGDTQTITYQDLLKNKNDENRFDELVSSTYVKLTLDGNFGSLLPIERNTLTYSLTYSVLSSLTKR